MDDKKMVVFSVSELEYGISGEFVQSIEKMMPITRVPFTQHYIKGVFNLRGVVIPVISLSDILQSNSSKQLEEQKIIIIKYEDTELGIIIDKATDVLTVNSYSLEPMDEKFELSHLFAGVLKLDTRLISIIDIERALFPDRKEE